MIDTNRTFG